MIKIQIDNVSDEITSEAVESRSALPRVISYIPYGEIFVEQQSGGWQSPYLFNSKELDSETGLYYYGARYLDPTSAAWLSVDPLWEKNIAASPYNYCHGNPIMMVDPNGENDYGLDSDGNIFLIKRTDSNSDKLISGVSKKENKKDGSVEIKGLKYEKDGSLKNSSIEVKKGSFSRENRTSYTNQNGTRVGLFYKFSSHDKNQVKKIFEFLAMHTDIEWSFYNKRKDKVETFYLSTSFEKYKEIIGADEVYKAKKEGIDIDFHYHNHPYDKKASADENATPSENDKNFRNKMNDLEGNTITIFRIYSRGTYRDYSK